MNQVDYILFMCSRFPGGIFGSLPSALGVGTIMDIFFYERGKAFLCYSISLLLGTIAGSTFGGFILTNQSWTMDNAAAGNNGNSRLLYYREHKLRTRRYDWKKPYLDGYLALRLKTYFPGTSVTLQLATSELVRHQS